MLNRQRGQPGTTGGPFPLRDSLPLHPQNGLAGRVVGRAERYGLESAHPEVVVDSRQLAVDRVHRFREVVAERIRVEQSPDLRGGLGTPGNELTAPSEKVPAEGPDVGAEDMVDIQVRPEVVELVGGLPEGSVVGRQVCRVDRAGTHAGDDRELQVWEPARQIAEDSGLVGGPGSATPHDEREIAVAAIFGDCCHRFASLP